MGDPRMQVNPGARGGSSLSPPPAAAPLGQPGVMGGTATSSNAYNPMSTYPVTGLASNYPGFAQMDEMTQNPGSLVWNLVNGTSDPLAGMMLNSVDPQSLQWLALLSNPGIDVNNVGQYGADSLLNFMGGTYGMLTGADGNPNSASAMPNTAALWQNMVNAANGGADASLLGNLLNSGTPAERAQAALSLMRTITQFMGGNLGDLMMRAMQTAGSQYINTANEVDPDQPGGIPSFFDFLQRQGMGGTGGAPQGRLPVINTPRPLPPGVGSAGGGYFGSSPSPLVRSQPAPNPRLQY